MSPTRSGEQVKLTSSKKTAWRQPPMPHAQTEQHGLKCVASLTLLYVVNFAQLVFPQITRKNSRTARCHPSVQAAQRTEHGLSKSSRMLRCRPLTSPWFVRSDLSGAAHSVPALVDDAYWNGDVAFSTRTAHRPRHQPAQYFPSDNATDTTSRFPQRRQSTKSQCTQNLTWHISSRETNCNFM